MAFWFLLEILKLFFEGRKGWLWKEDSFWKRAGAQKPLPVILLCGDFLVDGKVDQPNEQNENDDPGWESKNPVFGGKEVVEAVFVDNSLKKSLFSCSGYLNRSIALW